MVAKQSVRAKVSFFASEGERGYRFVLDGVIGLTFQYSMGKLVYYIDGDYLGVLGSHEEYPDDELRVHAQPLIEEHLRTRFPSLALVRFEFTWK
jgi:hypothetical protein